MLAGDRGPQDGTGGCAGCTRMATSSGSDVPCLGGATEVAAEIAPPSSSDVAAAGGVSGICGSWAWGTHDAGVPALMFLPPHLHWRHRSVVSALLTWSSSTVVGVPRFRRVWPSGWAPSSSTWCRRTVGGRWGAAAKGGGWWKWLRASLHSQQTCSTARERGHVTFTEFGRRPFTCGIMRTDHRL